MSNETSPSPPMVRDAASSRRQSIVTLLVLAAAAGLVLLLLEIRASRGHLDALASAACRGDVAAASELRRYLYAVLAIVPGSAFGFAAYVAVVARRARSAEVFPPPGTWILRGGRTFTGPAVRRIAVLLHVFSATLAALAILLALIGVRMLALLDR